METRIKRALRESDSEYVEIHIEESVKTGVQYIGKELENIGTQIEVGGNVRAYHKGGWGFVSFNDFKGLEGYVRFACRQAKLIGGEEGGLVISEPIVDFVHVELKDNPKDITISEKERVIRKYNEIILSNKKITTSNVRYNDTSVRYIYANSIGTYIEQERIYCGLSFNACAKDGTNVQNSLDSMGGTKGFNTVLNLESEVERVTKEAVDLLSAEKPEGGIYTVIADQHLAGTFAHEAFGHLSEGDFVYENEKLREIMKIGTRFGAEQLSIVDDGSIPGERGYFKYDDEGTPSQKTYLIKNGILVGRLHSRETAYKMNEPLSGNARSISYRFPPIVRMSCTYIESGNKNFEKMLEEIEYGIYAKFGLAGQTELEMFTFSSGKAYLIRNGKIDRMLRDVILSGNVFDTLKNIDAIGDDLKLFGGLGGCGKANQFPLPISAGGPHIRIRNVVIGGK